LFLGLWCWCHYFKVEKNYKQFIEILDFIIENNIDFPSDCRHIGSFLTNIYQCSQNKEEKIWAQACNMFLQMEKIQMNWSKNCEYLPKKEFYNDTTTFEAMGKNPDIFRNVFIRDMMEIKHCLRVFFLYSRALYLLKNDTKSLTYKRYKYNSRDKQSIDNFIKFSKTKPKIFVPNPNYI